MQERTLNNLILENEDYIFAGNLTINGDVNITNGSLVVSGTLTLNGHVKMEGGNIVCGFIDSGDITMIDGDICVNGDAEFNDIESDGNIEIGGSSESSSISCFNFLVNGDNDSLSITAMQDVYILGSSDSFDIEARDIFIGGDCNFNAQSLIAKAFVCNGTIENCSYIEVG